MTTVILQKILLLVTVLSVYLQFTQAQSHSDATTLYNDKLANYFTEVRPIQNQSEVINVNVTFDLVAIDEIDDVHQRFVVNGFLTLAWIDEIVPWDPASYNNIQNLNPKAEEIWRPRLILFNTLGARDLFEDDISPIIVLYTGKVSWYPGSLFPVSCKLNIRKFPFDKQECYIMLVSMSLTDNEVNFTATHKYVYLGTYTESGTWIIEDTEVTTGILFHLAYFKISFTLQRRAGFFIVNIVLPVVAFSFLNILVFLIPVDSGEKISYGITVLLALSVFLSVVSDMLPQSSDNFPLVTIYLSVLLITSVGTVVMSIFIVWLHHREEEEVKSQRSKSNFRNLFNKIRWSNRATVPIIEEPEMDTTFPDSHKSAELPPVEENGVSGFKRPSVSTLLETLKENNSKLTAKLAKPMNEVEPDNKPKVNKYKIIGKHIDFISFIVFMTLWVIFTIAFIAALAS